MTTKTTTKKANTKRGSAKNAAAKKAAKSIDIAALDQSRDDTTLDESASCLTGHAETLAATVRAKIKGLAKAKVSIEDSRLLLALAEALREAETTWRNKWKSSSSGAVAKARAPARKGRDQLFSALRVFAYDSAKTQSVLDDIAGVDNDADLLSDLDRLIALGKEHRADLDGTDSDAAFVAKLAVVTKTFRDAKAGARSDAKGEPGAVELSDEAIAARRVRNRVFWTLADLDRKVCMRGTHAFRDDPRAAKLFAAYTTRTAAPKKTLPK